MYVCMIRMYDYVTLLHKSNITYTQINIELGKLYQSIHENFIHQYIFET